MDCPVCRKAMVVLELDEIEIDHCPQCRGIWLDGGELELLLQGTAGKDQLLNSLPSEPGNKEHLRRCPICRRSMAKVIYGLNPSPVLIDKCRKNDGLWFDAGELEKVLESGSFGQDNRVVHLLQDMFGRKITQ